MIKANEQELKKLFTLFKVGIMHDTATVTPSLFL